MQIKKQSASLSLSLSLSHSLSLGLSVSLSLSLSCVEGMGGITKDVPYIWQSCLGMAILLCPLIGQAWGGQSQSIWVVRWGWGWGLSQALDWGWNALWTEHETATLGRFSKGLWGIWHRLCDANVYPYVWTGLWPRSRWLPPCLMQRFIELEYN